MAERAAPWKPDQEQRNLVEGLTAFGMRADEQVLLVKGPHGRALRVEEFAEAFAEEIKIGRAKANAQIGRALYERALAGNTKALREWQRQTTAEQGGGTVETRELAQWLGITSAMIAEMEKRDVIHKSAYGLYPLRETVTAVLAHYREIAAGRGGEVEGLALASARSRLATAQAEGIERKNAHERGELVPIRDVIVEMQSCNRQVTQHILSIPSQCAVELAALAEPREVHVLLTRLLREALEGLCQKFGSVRRGNGAAEPQRHAPVRN